MQKVERLFRALSMGVGAEVTDGMASAQCQ